MKEVSSDPSDDIPKPNSNFTCSIQTVSHLSESDRQAWDALCASDFNFDTPLLSPDFAELISKTRKDVKCILVRETDTERLVGVLCVHKRSFGLIRPVGAPFSDYAGPIIAKDSGLTLETMLSLSGYSSYRTGTSIVHVDENGVSEDSDYERSFIIDLKGQSAADHLEGLRSQHAKRFKNFRRLMNKLERECGEVEFVFGAPTELSLDRLLEWKSSQFMREGFLDVITAGNAGPILTAVANLTADEGNSLSGFMTGLKINGELIAGHFGVRDETNFHPWISAFDPKFEPYSPGILLLYMIMTEMDAMGLKTYDLSTGHESYKKYFCNGYRFTQNIDVYAPNLRGTLHKYSFQSWDLIGAKNSQGPAARMRRRFDHIFVSEKTLLARTAEILFAIRRRGVSRGN